MKIPVATLIFTWSLLSVAQSSSSTDELGKILYFDKRLSVNDSVSCQSCHNISAASKLVATGTDGRSKSVGIYGRTGGRNAPTVWNSRFRQSLFWDGRAKSLEQQASGPILNHVEMGMSNMQQVVDKLSSIKGYKKLFKRAFGDEQITGDRIVVAIASFERQLLAKNSPFDRFLNGDTSAIDIEAQNGWKKFNSYSCISCHGAATFLERDYFVRFPMNQGSIYEKKYDIKSDKGRFEYTKNYPDINRWRVPSLRNVELTAPYLHNGAIKDLEEVVKVMGKVQLNRDLSDQDIKEIVAFLKSLTGDLKPIPEPKMPQ